MAVAEEERRSREDGDAMLILLRHGQSVWNVAEDERFTGWSDVPLTPRGREEAAAAGEVLRRHGVKVDTIYTSVLRRAVETARTVHEACGDADSPVLQRWRLNERHYGALQGLNKKEAARDMNAALVTEWRRSWALPPPPMTKDHPLYESIRNDARYADVPDDEFPVGESIEMCAARLAPTWREEIAPRLAEGRVVLVCAHANSLRGLIGHIFASKGRDLDEALRNLHIPTGVPLVYNLRMRSCTDQDQDDDLDSAGADSVCILGPDPRKPLYQFYPIQPPDSCGFLEGSWLFPLEECPVLWDDYLAAWARDKPTSEPIFIEKETNLNATARP